MSLSCEKVDDIPDQLAGIRIARISTVPFFVATQLKKQIESLLKRGAIVTVVTSPGTEIGQLRRIHGVEILVMDIPRGISFGRNLLALLRIWYLFKKRNFDITHSTTPMAGFLTSIAAFVAGVPIRLHTFTGQSWVNQHGIKGWFAKTGDKVIGRLNTLCYTDGDSQMGFLVEQQIISKNNLKVIEFGSLAGVDLIRFNASNFNEDQQNSLRNTLSISSDAKVLLFVGRITPDKGVRELILAFSRIKNDGSNAHLILIGPFDSDSGVSNSISQNEIIAMPELHLIGYSDCPEQYMSISDILCLPSYREGFGTVVIEAAAMGVPTVGSDIYGLTDAVVHGESGVLVPPEDVDALYKGISLLLSDQLLCKKMGQSAKERAEKLFSADRVNDGVVKEYHRLLQDKKFK
jgi:glycosyltransferase involved in cell wall biosynthesis